MKLEFRTATFAPGAIDEENRTVRVAFSSETPVEREFGREILSHAPGACDLSRLNNRAAVLSDHDLKKQVGVVEKAAVENGMGRAILRFGKSAAAQSEWQDIVDGIRSKVSIGYTINQTHRKRSEDGIDEVTAVRWCPHEISIVSVEADPATGIGRSISTPTNQPATMAKEINNDGEPSQAELLRRDSLRKFGNRVAIAPDEIERAIENGIEFETFTRNFTLGEYSPVKVSDNYPKGPLANLDDKPRPRYGKRNDFAGQFSLVRGIQSICSRGGSLDGFESEVSSEIARGGGQRAGAFEMFVPFEELSTRALQSGSTPGSYLAEDVYAPGIVGFLSEHSVMANAGATVNSGITGGGYIAKVEEGLPTAEWLSEGSASTASDGNFSNINCTGYTVHASTRVSINLTDASPGLNIEAQVRSSVARAVARAIDDKSLNGSGTSNEPMGLINSTGVGSVSAGGAALTLAKVLEFESDVAASNADLGKLAWVTNPFVRAKMKATPKVSSTDSVMLYESTRMEGMLPVGTVNGYDAYTTNFAAGTAATGDSTVIYGDWSQLEILMWGGGVRILVDPYTRAANRETVIHAYATVDILVRRPVAFSVATDVLGA